MAAAAASLRTRSGEYIGLPCTAGMASFIIPDEDDEDKMSEKKKSLTRKSVISLAILGIVLLLGTGLAGGRQIYQQNLDIYDDAAISYANMISYQIRLNYPDYVFAHPEEIRRIQESFQGHGSDEEYLGETYDRILETCSEDEIIAYDTWATIEEFMVGFGNICGDIRYAYVVIPKEEDKVLIWDSNYDRASGLTTLIPFTHVPYEGNEKEHLMAVMRGDVEMDFFTERTNGELIGTALCPICDEKDRIFAVAAVDISITSIQSGFFKLLFHVGFAILVIMLISITVYHYVIRRQIIKPIVTLTRAADGLVNSLKNEDSKPVRVNVHTGDEIDVLARSFEKMDERLISFIRENAVITAENGRIEAELSLAARIQADMLPSRFPAFPDRKEIDLYASMSPAREVGGDFYDFFMIDEDRLGLVMADVSGKGVPAALFMMMSKIMIQNFAMTLSGPKEVLEKVNDQICKSGGEEMFVTVWLGVLDLKTGLITAVNAGHEYPVIKKPDQDFELIDDDHGLVIGGIPGFSYGEYEIQLVPGSRLFLYTDGLPEAADARGNMFGLERVLSSLNEVKEGSPEEVLNHVAQSVTAFEGNAPQFDDMTMLCLDYIGPDRIQKS